ncbi:hypothetical protein Vadar_019206 [Vaccinium darrowii]|uniref:Uncharacterized protein n=1 Tax=Vaccinium darrowii TaxID=229202 RepID=A0ACB7XRN9_9ERIC|nr:hypothetical protein Vadar_019206 [Vaccinium darrowii]
MDPLLEIGVPSTHHRSRRNLTNQQRQMIFEMLLMKVEKGKLKRGSIPEVAAIFSANPKTVRKICQQAMACFTNGLVVDVSSKLPRGAGRKQLQIDLNKVSEVDISRRTNIRSLSAAMKVSKSTLHRRIKEGEFQNGGKICFGRMLQLEKAFGFCLKLVQCKSK